MAGIQGLGGIPEPLSARQLQGRDSRSASASPNEPVSGDDVSISAETSRAASLAGLTEFSESQDAVRLERVEQAKEQIEAGTYRLQEVVLQVAARIAQFVN